jgi:secondary thiamine-phosphate synthase enzyme
MRQALHTIKVRAPRRGLAPITDEIQRWVAAQQIDAGLLTVFCRHTSASLLIQENAAPAARADLEKFFARIAPDS